MSVVHRVTIQWTRALLGPLLGLIFGPLFRSFLPIWIRNKTTEVKQGPKSSLKSPKLEAPSFILFKQHLGPILGLFFNPRKSYWIATRDGMDAPSRTVHLSLPSSECMRDSFSDFLQAPPSLLPLDMIHMQRWPRAIWKNVQSFRKWFRVNCRTFRA